MLCLQMQLQTQMTLATCPVRYAGAFNAAAAAVPYVAWPIIHIDYSMGGRTFMQRRQCGQEASRPGSATIFQCPQARLLTSEPSVPYL